MGEFCSRLNSEVSKPKKEPVIGSCSIHNMPIYKKILTCESHMLCSLCELNSYYKKFCIKCFRTLSNEELLLIKSSYFKSCLICDCNPISAEVAACGCILCKKCLEDCNTSNKGRCQICCGIISISLEEELKKKAMKSCDICFSMFNRDQMLTLDCDHFFCEDCLKAHTLAAINDQSISKNKGIPCPKCSNLISDLIIQSILSSKEFDDYVKIQIRSQLTDCPKCGTQFTVDYVNVQCPKCSFKFCKNCKRNKEKCDCNKTSEEYLSSLDVSHCPGCKTPYTKDEGCEHVTCQKEDCGVDFCFKCCAFRQPTMQHGNHYHRPSCPFFQDYDGKDDKFSTKCQKCVEKGKLCDRPKNLKTPRRFQPGEY